VTRLAGKVVADYGRRDGDWAGRLPWRSRAKGAGVAVAGRGWKKIREVAREIQKEGGAGFARSAM